MTPGAPYALHELPSASSFAGSHFRAACAPLTLYGMLPWDDGLSPAPIGPLFGLMIAPGGPDPKSPFGAVSMRVCQSSVMTAVQYPVRLIGARAFAVCACSPPRAPR